MPNQQQVDNAVRAIMEKAVLNIETRDDNTGTIVAVERDDVYYDYRSAGSSRSDFDKRIIVRVDYSLEETVRAVIELLLEANE